jgi:D-beta-D-heptose 7-phosphate kinase/D-beta-D-heptose 1-phosphate adenosyltransferase
MALRFRHTEGFEMCVIAKNDLEAVVHSLREQGRRIVFTNGCFDLLHPGHCLLLEEASGHGDVLIVAINDDESVRRLKGPGRPIVPAEERAELLCAVRWVDHVTIFSEDTPMETIRLVQPDVLVKGAEYAIDAIVGADYVRNRGGEVVRVGMKNGYSSRGLIDRINQTTR